MKRASVLVYSFLFVCMMATSATAGGFALYEWSNRGIAMGTTGYAIPADASVIATNPAMMTKLEGKRALVGVTAISPQTTVVVDDHKSKTQAKIFAVPHAYYTQQMESNEDVWLGVGLFTRFGLGTYYDDEWAGKASLQHVEVESISLNPNIGFRLNDQWSMAVGVEVLKGGIDIKRNILGNDIKADTEGYAVGANIAFHYQIDDEWAAGFTYRSPMRMHTTGSATNEMTNQRTSTGQQIKSTLPDSYTVAIGYQPSDEWNFEFDVVHTRWELTKNLTYTGDVLNTTTALNYKNTWRFQFGGEWWAMDNLAVRLGYVWDQTPTRAGDASFMLPSNDRQLFSTGLGYKFNKDLTIDWSFMYVISKGRQGVGIDNPIGADFNVDFKDGQTWISGLSLGYAF